MVCSLLMLSGLSHADNMAGLNQSADMESLKISILGSPPESTAYKIAQAMADDLSRRLKVNLTVVNLPGQRSIEYLKSGKIDGDWSRVDGFNQVVPGLIKVSEPMASHPFLAYSLKRDIKINGWESLKPFRVVYLRGWKIIERELKDVHEHLHPVDDASIALALLIANRADVFVHVPYVIEPILKTHEFKYSGIQALSPPLDYQNVHTYLLEKHQDLANRMAIALKEMKKDGSYDALVYGKGRRP